MKLILKILIILILVISLPISVYYGFRFFDEPMYMEFNNRSYVVTLPSRVWFEVNTSLDQVGSDSNPGNLTRPLEDARPQITGQGINIGLSYPKLLSTIKNSDIKKEQLFSRDGDSIKVEQTININGSFAKKYDFYIVNLFFSQYGKYDEKSQTYSQEGCDVQVVSENGKVNYVQQEARIYIEYKMENTIEDNLQINVKCFEK